MPGEENALLLTAMRKKYHFQTAYFMLTRGERQPNFSGQEKGVDLGIIHTSEMQAASQIGHFDLFASSYMDVGSRDSSTLFKIWNRKNLVADLSFVIQSYQPDIIVVGRTDPNDSTVTWLNQLCLDANQLAAFKAHPANNKKLADETKQSPITHPTPFGATCILTEVPKTDASKSGHATNPRTSKDKAKDLININLAGYDSINGMTYREIALKIKQEERSVFPDLSNIPINSDTLAVQLLYGNTLPNLQTSNKLGTWSRLAKGTPIQLQLTQLLTNQAKPGANRSSLVDSLIALYMNVRHTVTDVPLRLKTSTQLKKLILQSAGINVTAYADRDLGILGQRFKLTVNMHSPLKPLTIRQITLGDLLDTSFVSSNVQIQKDKKRQFIKKIHLPLFQPAYQPFWLNKPWNADYSYQIDPIMQGRLADTACYQVQLSIQLDSLPLEYSIPVVYQKFDRNKGQQITPFYTVEPLLLMQSPDVLLTQIEGDTKINKHPEITLRMRTLFQDSSVMAIVKIRQFGLKGEMNGQVSKTGKTQEIYKNATYITPTYNQRMHVTIPYDESFAKKWQPNTPILKPQILLRLPDGAQAFSSNIKTVGYPYQKKTIYNFHSQTIIIGDTIRTKGTRIAYVGGAPEDIWQSAFHQLGYQVTELSPNDLLTINPTEQAQPSKEAAGAATLLFISDSLQKFDVIVWNNLPESRLTEKKSLLALHQLLTAYIDNGGKVLDISTQQSWRPALPGTDSITSTLILNDTNFVKLSVEAQHPLLNYPNKITADHFLKWYGLMANGTINPSNTTEELPIKVQYLQDAHKFSYPISSQKSGKGSVIHCLLDLPSPLSNGSPFAFKFLAYLLASPGGIVLY